MSEVTSGIRLTANAEGVVGESVKAADALKRIEDQAKKTGEAFGDMGRASRTAGEEQRRVAEEMRRAIDAQIQAREADANRKFEASGLAQQLEAQRSAQAALNAETERGSGAMRGATAEAIAMTAAKSGLRSAMSALMGLFTGPAGLISVLAAGALSWSSFGNAATDGVKASEEAAARARAGAMAASTPQSVAGNLAANVQNFQAQINDLEGKRDAANSAAYKSQLQAEIDQLTRDRDTAVSVLRFYPGAPEPGMSIADATKGLRTPTTARREFDERVRNLYGVYGAEMSSSSPEHAGVLQGELLEQYAAARRAFDSQMQGFAPKASGGRGGGGDGGRTSADALNDAAGVSRSFFKDLQLLHAEYERGGIGIEQYRGSVEALIAKQAFAKELVREEDQLRKAAQKSLEDYNRESAQASARANQEATQQENASRKLQEHAQEIGLTTAQLGRLRIARAEERVALEEQRVALSRMPEAIDGELAANERRLEAARRALDAAREGASRSVAVEQAKEAQQEWKRTSDSIERSLMDALMRGFDKGKGFAENFRDSLVNMFKTMVLEPIIRPIAQAGANLITGALSGGSGSGSGGGGGGALGGSGGIGNLASLGSSLYSAVSGNGILGSIGSALGIGGGAAISGTALAGELAALTGSGMASGAIAGGAMAGIGAAIPYVGLALAAYSLLSSDGGSDALPEIQLGFQHPGVDQARFASDAIYRQAAQQSEASHRSIYGVSWTQPNANGDGSPTAAVQRDIEAVYQQLMVPIQAEQASTQAQQARLSGSALGSGVLLGSLQGYVDSQQVSEYLSPEDRLAGARGMFDSAIARAGAGDIDAQRALPGLANQLLGAGRENFASGAQFQSLRADVNSRIVEVLEKDGQSQQALLADVPLSIRQAATDTVASIDRMRKDMIAAIERLNSRLNEVQMQGAT